MFIIDDALTPKLEEIEEKVSKVNLEPAFREAMTIMVNEANAEGPVLTGYITDQTSSPVMPEYDISSMVSPPTGHIFNIENALISNGEVVGQIVWTGIDNPINKDKPKEYAYFAEHKSSSPNFIGNMVAKFEKNPEMLLGGIIAQIREVFK